MVLVVSGSPDNDDNNNNNDDDDGDDGDDGDDDSNLDMLIGTDHEHQCL